MRVPRQPLVNHLSPNRFLGIGGAMHGLRASAGSSRADVLLKTGHYQTISGTASFLAWQLFRVFTYERIEPGERTSVLVTLLLSLLARRRLPPLRRVFSRLKSPASIGAFLNAAHRIR